VDWLLGLHIALKHNDEQSEELKERNKDANQSDQNLKRTLVTHPHQYPRPL
jgi:hypothetical protein